MDCQVSRFCNLISMQFRYRLVFVWIILPLLLCGTHGLDDSESASRLTCSADSYKSLMTIRTLGRKWTADAKDNGRKYWWILHSFSKLFLSSTTKEEVDEPRFTLDHDDCNRVRVDAQENGYFKTQYFLTAKYCKRPVIIRSKQCLWAFSMLSASVRTCLLVIYGIKFVILYYLVKYQLGNDESTTEDHEIDAANSKLENKSQVSSEDRVSNVCQSRKRESAADDHKVNAANSIIEINSQVPNEGEASNLNINTGNGEIMQISRLQNEFELKEKLGSGGYGVVMKARNKLDNQDYALKILQLPNKDDKREKVLREVKVLAKLDNIGTIRYYNAWIEKLSCNGSNNLDLFASEESESNSQFSHMNILRLSSLIESGSDLVEIAFKMNDDLTPSNSSSRIIFEERDATLPFASSRQSDSNAVEMTSSSSYVHFGVEKARKYPQSCPTEVVKPFSYLIIQMQLCHSETLSKWLQIHDQNWNVSKCYDIFDQPANIFFSMDGLIKIGDFGLAIDYNDYDNLSQSTSKGYKREIYTRNVGTLLYMSPEQVYEKCYNQKVDIYALGIILYELLHPMGTGMERIKLLSNLRERNEFDNTFSMDKPLEANFIRWLLCSNPKQRPLAEEILASEVYAKIKVL